MLHSLSAKKFCELGNEVIEALMPHRSPARKSKQDCWMPNSQLSYDTREDPIFTVPRILAE